MPRTLWIPVTLLALGAGAIGFFAFHKGAPDESCPACAAITVSDRDLARLKPVSRPAEQSRETPQKTMLTPCRPSPLLEEDDDAPDFSGIGIELIRTRHLIKLPSREEKVSPEELQSRLAPQLAASFPDGYGLLEGRALAALGAIPEPVDTVAQRTAIWAQLLGAWYDTETHAMLLAHSNELAADQEHALGQAFAFLMREHADWLKQDPAAPSSDAWRAHLSLLAGDAAFTARLHASSSAFKKTHPGGSVTNTPVVYPSHHFLQDLEVATFNAGENFAKALHHLGDFDQVNAAYERPPLTTAELLDAGLYFAEEQFESRSPAWTDLQIAGHTPFWDDALGELGMSLLLGQQMPENEAEDAVAGWQGDRWLVYDAAGTTRGHIAWQTYWKDKESADKFLSALQKFLHSKYPEAPSTPAAPDLWKWTAAGRTIILTHTDNGQGIFYADTANPEFADALCKKFTAP